MGKANDFLFQGKPPPNVNSNGVQTTQVPAYLQQYHEGVLARGNQIASQPYQKYGKQRLAKVDPSLKAGWNMAGQAADSYQPMFAQAGGQLDQAAEGDAAGAAQPWLDKAGGMSATANAQPALDMAMQSAPGQIGAHMSPYLTGVVDQIGIKGAQNLSENLLPAMGDDFIRSGQLGSSRHMSAAGKAMSDTQEAVSNAQNQALHQGYVTALGSAQNDMNRYAQVGATQGNLTLGEQQNTGALGQMAGNLDSVDTRNALDTANAQVSLGKSTQAAGLTGAAALETVGRGRMGEEQKNLDTAYQDFKDQREYPRNNVDWMAGLTKGQPNMGGSVYTDSNAPLPGSSYGPSGLAQIAGGVSLANAFGKAKGGYIDATEAEEAGVLHKIKRRPPPIRVPRRQREYA